MTDPAPSPTTDPRPAGPSPRALLGPAVVVLIALMLATAALVDRSGEPPARTDSPGVAQADDTPSLRVVERLYDGDPYAVGAVDAPVVLVEYADFQCGYCGIYARDTHPALMDRYVATGVLRIEYRDVPILGPESVNAALAARAAGNQGAFWEYHDALYRIDRTTDPDALSVDRLVDLAGALGLDTARFADDLDAPATQQAVQRDLDEAQALGVASTPTFLINGQPVIGAHPLETFVGIIEQAAAAAELRTP